MMKVFFDTEFTGLHQATQLISLGFISDDGQTFYAENCSFMDGYLHTEDREWAEENVIPHLKFYMKQDKGYNNSRIDGDYSGSSTEAFGETWLIKDSLQEWFSRFERVEIWSDCLAYDWVLFNELFGHAFNIPENIYYIPFDICPVMKMKGVDPDINREEFADMTEGAEKHNALWDAKVIQACYEKLQAA